MMWFKAEETLSEDQLCYALKNVIRDGVTSQAMGILTGGAFLVAFAVQFGVNNRKELRKERTGHEEL
jgi:hypothetical protein